MIDPVAQEGVAAFIEKRPPNWEAGRPDGSAGEAD
jgi:hypothetical protein